VSATGPLVLGCVSAVYASSLGVFVMVCCIGMAGHGVVAAVLIGYSFQVKSRVEAIVGSRVEGSKGVSYEDNDKGMHR
jgi:hypothetical protein